MVDNSLVQTPEFLRCLRDMLIIAPTTWSDPSSWDSLSEIEQRAIQRLHVAGLITYRSVIEFEWQPHRRFMVWTISGGIVRCTFETTGPRTEETIRMTLLNRFVVRNGKTTAKWRFTVLGQCFQFRLSDQGKLAKSDLQSGVREKIRYVDFFMVHGEALQRIEEVHSVHNAQSFSAVGPQATAVATAQSTASVGDVNVHVTPNIHIQTNVSGPFKLELPEGVVIGTASSNPVVPEVKKPTSSKRPRADKDECNRKLEEWAKHSRNKCYQKTHEQVAERLGCGVGTVGGLPAWISAKAAGLVPEKTRKDNDVRAIRVDGRTMDQFPGKSHKDQQAELDELIDEQQREMKSELRNPR